MQLLKLSYIAHGFNLAFYDEPLSKELAQAWKYGPVFPYIYHTFKYHPSGKNKRLGREAEPDPEGQTQIVSSAFKEEEQALMKAIHSAYGHLSGWQLSALTHDKNTPWYRCYHEGETPGNRYFGVPIPNKDIKDHFKDKLSKLDAHMVENG